MNRLGISEFLYLTQITESQLLGLLERGELRTEVSNEGELKLLLDEIELNDLIDCSPRRQARRDDDDLALIEEAIATQVIESLQGIIEDAVELVLKWQKKGEIDD